MHSNQKINMKLPQLNVSIGATSHQIPSYYKLGVLYINVTPADSLLVNSDFLGIKHGNMVLGDWLKKIQHKRALDIVIQGENDISSESV